MFGPHKIEIPCLIAAALLLAACSDPKQAAPKPAPEVGFITVAPRDVPQVSSFVAQTESSRQVEIVARVAGFLDRIAYAEGSFVKEGQVLFQIDPKPFKAQLDAAQGELAAQQARLTTSAATLKRVKPLAEQNALSQADLDRATGDFEMATAAVHSAQAKLQEAQLNLDYTTIRSPVSGSTGRALQREGAYVGAAAETARLTYVAALDPIWVTFSISQNQIEAYRDKIAKKLLVAPAENQYAVELVLPGNRAYPHRGRINFADPSFSQDTGSFMVRAAVPNPDKELRPGMFVSVNLHGTIRPGAVILPQLAVQQGARGHFVVLANAKNEAEIRPVVVGPYLGDKEILIDQGLKAGDRVIVDGFARLAPNIPVIPVPAEKRAATPADNAAEKPAGKPAEKSTEKPAAPTAPSAR
jgi:membrane fusion protein (multidrug efflux system)